jgi:hypothetical protein
MDNKPKALTNKEIKEIAPIGNIQQMWGAENTDEMVGILQVSSYAVKFDFISGGPGYVGDLYVLFGDAHGEPVRLIRVKGRLEIFD